ncbi:hypothetical protein ACJX0J_030442, partial [Zea mays]
DHCNCFFHRVSHYKFLLFCHDGMRHNQDPWTHNTNPHEQNLVLFFVLWTYVGRDSSLCFFSSFCLSGTYCICM